MPGHRAKSTKEKVHGVKLGRKQMKASKDLLPVESHRPHFIPPGMCCDNTCEVANQGSLQRLSTSGFCWGLATQALSACHVPTLHTPTGKPLFSINHLVHLVYASEPFLPVLGMVSSVPKSKFPDASQWPTS